MRNTKNARGDQIPLRADLAEQLRLWVSHKLPDATVFTVPHDLREILYRDLAAAGISRIDERGRQVDVHGFRHTAATQLAKSGVLPQVAMRIMRHSSITMTMKHYTHLALTDTGRAVEMLADFENHSPAAETMKKTRTDGSVPKGVTKTVLRGGQNGAETQSFFGSPCPGSASRENRGDNIEAAQLLMNEAFGTTCHRKAKCPELDSNQHEPKLTSPSS